MTPATSPSPTSPPYAVDASPLIGLAKIGRLDLLTTDRREVLVTDTVYREILAGDQSDPARLALIGGFGKQTPDVPLPAPLAAWNMDAGEAQTLALAASCGGIAVVDDLDGRRAARAFGILHTGTTGLVLAGKRRGIVTSAADVLRALQGAGIFLLSDARLQGELAQVGEMWP